MKILSLNVWGGQLRDPLLRFLESHADTTDIFCLQEMTSSTVPIVHQHKDRMTLDLAEQIQAILPNHRLALAPSRDRWGEQLALFTHKRFQVIDQGFIKVVAAGPVDVPSSDGAYLQFVAVEVGRSSLTVAHLHGYWEKDDGEDKPPRDEQVDNLLKFINGQPHPIVLCGDLNMNRRTRGVARLSDKLQNLIEMHSIPTTRPASNPYHGTVGDYLFASPELTIRSFDVLDDEVSDHLALLADIDLSAFGAD